MVMHCDDPRSLGLIMSEIPRLLTHLKHVDAHNCWLPQEVQAERITTPRIPTAKMPAHGLSKPLPNQKQQNLIRLIDMVDISDLII